MGGAGSGRLLTYTTAPLLKEMGTSFTEAYTMGGWTGRRVRDSVHIGDSSFSVTFDLIQEAYNGFFVTGAEWVGIWGMAFSELAKVLRDKLKELKDTTKAFFSRLKQTRDRPEAVQQLRDTLNVSQDFLSRLDNLSLLLDPDDQVFTEVEKEGLRTLYQETEKWLNGTEARQKTTPLSDEPVLVTEEVLEKTTRVDREIMYLLNKLKLYRPKPKPTPQPNVTAPPTGSDTKQEEEVSNEADESSTEETVGTGSEGGTQQGADTEGDADSTGGKGEELEMETGTQQKGGSQRPDSDAEVETGDSQTGNVDEAVDTPALEAPEVDESSPEEETVAPPEAERHKEL